jgi:hypothetical protein
MIRPIQRLPSVLLLLERLLKYTPLTHADYQQLTNAIDKLREVARKLNEERGKTEKHLSLFSIVNSIDNCPVRILEGKDVRFYSIVYFSLNCLQHIVIIYKNLILLNYLKN